MEDEALRSIDWERMWEEWTQPSTRLPRYREELWDTKARLYERMVEATEYAGEFMSQVEAGEDDTVLDIACGPGTLTLPFAERVKHVTALDQSGKMLDILQEKMTDERISNITVIRKKWEDTYVDTDIPQHDIVIRSRYWYVENLYKEILKPNRLRLNHPSQR